MCACVSAGNLPQMLASYYTFASLAPLALQHFICLLTTLYLPLFAVTSAIEAGTGDDIHWSAGVIKGLVVLLQAIFVLGLRVLGQKMSDPYGDDLIDLSVMYYVEFTWTNSN